MYAYQSAYIRIDLMIAIILVVCKLFEINIVLWMASPLVPSQSIYNERCGSGGNVGCANDTCSEEG